MSAVTIATVDQLRERIRRKSKLKGRQPDDVSLLEVRALIGPRPLEGHRRDLLIEHLHLLNDAYRCLHERHLVALAREMNIPMAEVYEVASFYHHFEIVNGDAASDKQAPGLMIRVCDGLSCELAGAQDLLARLPALLGARDARVVAAPCLGRCEQAPAAVVHQTPVLFATPQAVLQASNSACAHVRQAQSAINFVVANWAEKSIPALPGYTDYATYRAHGGYALAASLVNGEEDAEHVLQAMEHSGLRGLGGAGFPAGRKWRIVREQNASRLMAVNIDEGEPGTFKDRTYLERDPHRFLEGVLIAAQVMGVEACHIYLRDEYHGCRALLQAELAKLRADPPCPLPLIELRRGAGAYICGEESAMSDPDLNLARHALASLEHLVVQEIFMTETAWLADVVLPASAWPEKTGTATNTDRMVQMGRQAINSPGDARADLWIIQKMAAGMGLNWHYEGEHHGVAAVYEEMRRAMHASIAGISWERLQRESSVIYPCLSEGDLGAPTVFMERFDTDYGRVHLVPADIIPADERPDAEFPFVLITGRQLEHWHTGSMTRRAAVLDAIEPMATASLCGADLARLGVMPDDVVTVQSRRGSVAIHVRRDDGTPPGAVFIPFAYYEAAANLMTNAALNPFGKIPEFKYCAVSIRRGTQENSGPGV